MHGLCGRLVNEMGMRKIGIDKRATGCRTNLDCPSFFRCRRTGAMEGGCVR